MNKRRLGMTAAAALLLLGGLTAQAATTVNLTAQRSTLTMPDGKTVPMWGYCGAAVAGGAGTASGGACPAAGTAAAWTPGPTITVPAGDALTISLSNTLPTPTSLTIVGQFGGGIGQPTKAASPVHATQTTSTLWSQTPGVGPFTPPGQADRARSFAPEADGLTGTYTYTWNNLKPGTYLYQSGTRPSLQVPMGLYGLLVVTNGTAAGVPSTVYFGAGTSWTSKTGVIGSVLCSTSVFGDPLVGTVKSCSYLPATSVPANATNCAAENGTCTLPAGVTATVWYGAGVSWTSQAGVTGSILCANSVFGDPDVGVVKSCSYLPAGSVPTNAVSCAVENATCTLPAAVAGGAGTAYTATTAPLKYDAEGALLFGEVDPIQNAAVDAAAVSMAAAQAPTAANKAAYAALEQRLFNDATCATTACYPPAVNYAPTYFTINGNSFDPANPGASAVVIPNAPVGGIGTGRVLLRLANAGLKTHMPTLVGLPMTIVAEDGNLQPDVAVSLVTSSALATPKALGKVQSEVHLAAGKTTDVVVSPPYGPPGKFAQGGWHLFDRQLSLSGGNKPNAGMQGFVVVAPAGTTAAQLNAGGVTLGGVAGAASVIPTPKAAAANNDTFNVPANSTAFSGNVLLNDVGISAVIANGALPTGVTLNTDGTFKVAGAPIGSSSFGYCQSVNGVATALCATVTLTVTADAGAPTLAGGTQVFTSNVATLAQIPHPGVLIQNVSTVTGTAGGWTSPKGYALSASASTTLPAAPASGQIYASTAPSCAPASPAPTGTTAGTGTCTVTLYTDGAFTATASAPGAYSFTYYAVNSQKKASAAALATIVFKAGSNVNVTVKDSVTGAVLPAVTDPVSNKSIADYRWVIEQDDTFLHDPSNAGFVPPVFPTNVVSAAITAGTTNQVTLAYGPGTTANTNFPGFKVGSYVQVGGVSVPDYNGVFRINSVTGTTAAGGTITYTLPITPATVPAAGTGGILTNSQSLATNFHRSHMPVVAAGCTGVASCGDKQKLGGTAAGVLAPRSSPADVALDPTKKYYISVLPGDAGMPAAGLAGSGHTMGGASIAGVQISAPTTNPVTVLTPENPLPPGQMSIIVFEDNFPISGDVDDDEVGLGGFEVVIYDTRGSSGDQAGQITYDLFNQPLTNALANTPGIGTDGKQYSNLCPTTPNGVQAPVGVIYTCLPVVVNGLDISPFTGMALVKNVIPGRIDVQAHPAAWREGAGEQWIQVSTLEGTPNNDSFVHAGEPAYWQEFGPPGFHSFIGFINPAHIAARNTAVATNLKAANAATPFVSVTGRVTNLHMDRPPQAKLNDSCQPTTPGTAAVQCARAALNYTQCYVALNSGGGTGETIAFAQCDSNGNFTLKNVPPDTYELFIWDEWLDQIKAKKVVIVAPTVGNGTTVPVGDVPVFNWFTRLQETTYLDLNGNGKRDPGEPGLTNLPQNVRFRDGSFSNRVSTDADGNAFHNELFPLFNWYVLESDQTRYKNTGTHIIYDAGGIPDQADLAGQYFSTTGVLNSTETFPVPLALRVPGAWYNGDGVHPGKTERIDPPNFITQGTQGFINQTQFLEWGKQPFAPGENGGISGMIYFASVRAFDDPRLKVQNLLEPGIPRVQVNLYQRTTNADGTFSDVLIDTTTSTSWDDWAMGSSVNAAGQVVPNMNCPGQAPASASPPSYVAGQTDLFVNYTLGTANQNKCYDGQHSFNQVQPAVYDGYYAFPTANCTVCNQVQVINNATGGALLNPDGSNPGTVPMLPPGQYVVEVVRPAGYEITKEEDKNILIGDTWIAAAAQQFNTLQDIFILPDQATLNNNNPQGFSLVFPPCVGIPHLVPDYLTVVPEAKQVAPFAGQVRPLCDKKLVTLEDQMAAGGDFQLWTSTPVSGHVAGLMLNDASAEFDPYNPSFGEKFALPNAPVSVRDFNGVEIYRAYTDKWGTFNFLNPSTWEANVPNPSGYAPNMLTYCMNDPGPVPDPSNAGKFIVDPNYNPQYSDFCYNWPMLPGITTYLDTPVLPVSAFALNYAPVDCQYPASTPAIKRVDGNWIPTLAQAYLPSGTVLPTTATGPYVDIAKASPTITITALGDTSVLNPSYAGPTGLSGSTYQANRITRHYGFGATAGVVQLYSNQGGLVAALTVATGAWTDTKIVASIPTTLPVGAYQLVIKTSTGLTSTDAVTVTVDKSTNAGYRAPWYVAAPLPATAGLNAGGLALAHPIQDAIDKANPGDLIIIDSGLYPELAVMWKPVRLQGVGAASTVIQATKYPNIKIADWRSRINMLFGLNPEGYPLTDPNTGAAALAQIDPLPGQEVNTGIVRIEPSALSTEEGAGITVLAANTQTNPNRPTCGPLVGTAPAPTANFWPAVPFGFYPTGGSSLAPPTANQPVAATVASRGYSDFACFPSRIDGLSVTGSDAGGGIYVNGWAHNLEISNNRVFGNSGPYSGGVRIGQPYLQGQVLNPLTGTLAYNVNVNIHHNAITTNGTDEAAAAPGSPVGTSGAGGGLSIDSGSDNFRVANNWICGNYSAGDGGGVGVLGNSTPGQLVNNSIIFNEAYQQTGVNYGGGLAIEGEPGSATVPSTGVGNVVVDGNLIQGNSVRSGSGGGIRVAAVNGTEVTSTTHFTVTLTNNMVVNNVAGWAGAGISLVDAPYAIVFGNTIANNDSVGTAGNLMNQPMTGAPNGIGATTSVPNPAGIATEAHSLALAAVLSKISALSASAKAITQPQIFANNIIWHNRAFFFDASSGTAKICTGNAWTTAAAHTCTVLPAQASTGQCTGTPAYWDIGVVGDTSAAAPGTNKLVFNNTVITSVTGYSGTAYTGNQTGDPLMVKPYCNGGRVQPGTAFEPGSPFQPPFALNASATLDESGNFVDFQFGPLSVTDPITPVVTTTGLPNYVGNYHLSGQSGSAYNLGATPTAAQLAASRSFGRDFDGGPRPWFNLYDIGADEYTTTVPTLSVSTGALNFGNVLLNSTVSLPVYVANTGTASMTLTGITVAGSTTYTITNGCGTTLAAGAVCVVTVNFKPTAAGTVTGTLTVAGAGPVATVSLTGTGIAASFGLSPTSLAFGTQTINTASAAKVITLTSTGSVPIVLSSLPTLTGTNANQFALTTTCVVGGTGLASGKTCTITVTFKPTAYGNMTAAVSIASNATAGTQTVLLTGATAQGAASFTAASAGTLSGSTLNVGFVPWLFSSSSTVTVTNSGTAPLVITAAGGQLTNTVYSQFSKGADTCAGKTLAVGGTCQITVNFSGPLLIIPSSAANLTLTHNGAGGSTTLSLTGY